MHDRWMRAKRSRSSRAASAPRCSPHHVALPGGVHVHVVALCLQPVDLVDAHQQHALVGADTQAVEVPVPGEPCGARCGRVRADAGSTSVARRKRCASAAEGRVAAGRARREHERRHAGGRAHVTSRGRAVRMHRRSGGDRPPYPGGAGDVTMPHHVATRVLSSRLHGTRVASGGRSRSSDRSQRNAGSGALRLGARVRSRGPAGRQRDAGSSWGRDDARAGSASAL